MKLFIVAFCIAVISAFNKPLTVGDIHPCLDGEHCECHTSYDCTKKGGKDYSWRCGWHINNGKRVGYKQCT